MKKLLTGIITFIFGLGLYAFVYATSSAGNYPDSFQIEVNPSSFKVNEAADFTITAIKNGEIMKNYDGYFDIYLMDENNQYLQSHEYTLPDGGWGNIKLEDQGVKPYTQGLILKKPGNFTLLVMDFMNENIQGTASITVNSDTEIDVGEIEILSPVQNNTEESSAISVLANAPKYSNSTIQIYLNGLLVKEGQTDGNGVLSETIQITQEGTNTLELKAVNIQGVTVAKSQIITFLYSPVPTDIFPEILMTPNKDLKLGQSVRFELGTDDHVNSASLIISGVQEYPMDKQSDGYFIKQVTLVATGEQVVNVQLNIATEARLFTGLYYFTVDDNIRITNLRIFADSETNGLIHLSWETEGGESDDYVVTYWEKGTNEEDAWTDFTQGAEHDVHVSPGKTYEFRVYATTPEHIADGVPSDVSEFDYIGLTGTGPDVGPMPDNPRPSDPTYTGEDENWSGTVAVTNPGETSGGDEENQHYVPDAPTCIVTSIQFETEQIGNKYYLIWSPVKNVEKYLIYRSDFADGSNKKYVGETELPRFEYPFDPKAKEETYAYYSIEAICTDGRKMMVSEANKVQVGPFEDMMLILIATVLLYLMYRIYTYRV